MANFPETSTFEPAVHVIGAEELVLGGSPTSPSNLPFQQLVNRTKWLKDAVDSLESGGGPFAYNASAGTLPVGGSDGAGVAGIRRKDYYFVTVAGTVSGVTLQVGDALIAMNDDADAIGEFIVSQANGDLATPTVIGMVKLVQNITGGSLSDAVLSTAGLITLFAQKASPAFTGTPTVPTPADGDNTTKIANTLWVLARIAEEATARANAVSSEATARANADTTLQNNINSEATTRGNNDTTLQNNINSEATARANGDTNEANARIAADNAIIANKANKDYEPTGWVTIPLINGWTAFGGNTPQYRIDAFGVVRFRGELNAAGSTSSIWANSIPAQDYGGNIIEFVTVLGNGTGLAKMGISPGQAAIISSDWSTAQRYRLEQISYYTPLP